jgi:ribose/xylose/arabinose/galactoside ABC-type transport system permease subunit
MSGIPLQPSTNSNLRMTMRKIDPLSILVFTREWGIVVLLAVLVGAFSIWAAPIFGTLTNFSLILGSAAISSIFAAAIAMGVLSGAIDLSVPGVAAIAGVIMAKLLTSGVNVWIAMAAAILVGLVIGLVNGLVTLRGVNPLAVTIGMLSVTGGLAAVISGGVPIFGLTDLHFVGNDNYFGVPAPVVVVALVYVVGTVYLTKTRGGTRFLAAGGNPEALRRVGVNANFYRVLGFVLSGALAAVGGIVTCAQTNQATPSPATGQLFVGLTAVALSGMALTGGRGSLPKVFVGSLVIATMSSALVIKNIQPYWTTAITGGLLIIALGGQLWLSKVVSDQVVARRTISAHKEVEEKK